MDPRQNFCSCNLYQAVMSLHVQRVDFMVSQNYIDLSYRDAAGNSPLHLAVLADNDNLATLLLDTGADMYDRNILDQTAYDIALVSNRVKCLKVLLKYGAQVHCRDYYYFAHGASYVDMSDLFFGHVKLDTYCRRGFYPIHHAVQIDNLHALKILLQRGDDVNRRTRSIEGYAPIHLAKSAKALRLLLNHGADVNCRTKFARSLLDCVTLFSVFDIRKRETEPMMEMLLNQGVDIQVTIRTGQIAYDFNESPEMIEKVFRTLLKHMGRREGWYHYSRIQRLKLLESMDPVSSYYRTCLAEIHRMRGDRLSATVSVADFVTKGKHLLVNYVKRAEIVSNFNRRKSAFKTLYPIYHNVISRQYRIAMRLKSLMRKARRGLILVTQHCYVNDIVTHKVLQYLDMDDLTHLSSLYKEYLEMKKVEKALENQQ